MYVSAQLASGWVVLAAASNATADYLHIDTYIWECPTDPVITLKFEYGTQQSCSTMMHMTLSKGMYSSKNYETQGSYIIIMNFRVETERLRLQNCSTTMTRTNGGIARTLDMNEIN